MATDTGPEKQFVIPKESGAYLYFWSVQTKYSDNEQPL